MLCKEAIEKLTQYFLMQDRKTLARILAGTMIDIHRMFRPDSMTKEERDLLVKRMCHNDDEIIEFLKSDKVLPLRCVLLNEDDNG